MHETAAFVVKPETSPERQAFYKRLDQVDTAPLWEVLNRLVLPLPQPGLVPAPWKYEHVRGPAVDSAWRGCGEPSPHGVRAPLHRRRRRRRIHGGRWRADGDARR